MLVDEGYVLCEVGWELLQVVEDLPEVFLDEGQDLGQLLVADASDHEVGHRVVLVADEQRELGIQSFHKIVAASIVLIFEFDAPVYQHALDKKVQADQELNGLFFLFHGVEPLCEGIDFQDLA